MPLGGAGHVKRRRINNDDGGNKAKGGDNFPLKFRKAKKGKKKIANTFFPILI